MGRWIVFLMLLLLLAFTPTSCRQQQLRVGSKAFTESVILGEIVKLLVGSTGVEAIHYQEMGGTRVLYKAVRNGDIDVYPEYTGTLREEIFAADPIETQQDLRHALEADGLRMTRPLGFNNTYAIGMLEGEAERRGIETISDLVRHPDLRFGFSSEFMDRADGWPNLRRHYGLPQRDVKGLDHDLAYRQLRLQAIDAIDVYTTDAKIDRLGIRVLADDRGYFPRYDAVVLYRADLENRHPAAVDSLRKLEGLIGERTMMQMNARTELEREAEAVVAADFLNESLGLQIEADEQSAGSRIWRHTVEHLDLVRKSLIPAVLVAIPLGILAAKRQRWGQGVLAAVGIVQTIPALALLVMLMSPVAQLGLTSAGLGSVTAIVALFLYSLLPIVRNTYTGLHDIAEEYRESALALGLPALYRLWHVELPLASRTILAGVKTAAVINIGFATLGALIGAGGYGQPILTGIRLADTRLIMQGAVPAAVLALAVQGLFEWCERFLVPQGLRSTATD